MQGTLVELEVVARHLARYPEGSAGDGVGVGGGGPALG